jgi:hypothetical protein
MVALILIAVIVLAFTALALVSGGRGLSDSEPDHPSRLRPSTFTP